MTTLDNVTWKKDENDEVIILTRKKTDANLNIVVYPFGKMRKNITLKTLVRDSIKDRSITLMISRRDNDNPGRIQMGPSGNAYATFLAQGLIQEHEPTIHIPGE